MTTQLPFTMSKHALDRALEMNVTGVEIRTCFEHPTDMYWSTKHEKWRYTRGRISLGVSSDHTTVITVLWSSQHDWRADYARGGDLAGRERRLNTDMTYLPRRRA